MAEFDSVPVRFNFQTINNAADALGLPRCLLRRAQKLGKVPGFYAGSRFYVNVDMLYKKMMSDMTEYKTPNMFEE